MTIAPRKKLPRREGARIAPRGQHCAEDERCALPSDGAATWGDYFGSLSDRFGTQDVQLKQQGLTRLHAFRVTPPDWQRP